MHVKLPFCRARISSPCTRITGKHFRELFQLYSPRDTSFACCFCICSLALFCAQTKCLLSRVVNRPVRADSYPHTAGEHGQRQRFPINVRCDLYVFVRGHCALPARWTGPVCRDYLEQSLAELQKDVILL